MLKTLILLSAPGLGSIHNNEKVVLGFFERGYQSVERSFLEFSDLLASLS